MIVRSSHRASPSICRVASCVRPVQLQTGWALRSDRRGVITPRSPLLFTPGPIETSTYAKQAMLSDYGSRDKRFLDVVAGVRSKMLEMAGTSKAQGHDCVIMQGSGTMGVEAMLGSLVPKGGKVLIAVNGAYGLRQRDILLRLGVDHEVLQFSDKEAVAVKPVLEQMQQAKSASSPFTHVSIVHHETTTGVLNPLEEFIKAVKADFPEVVTMVDSMSGFGAYDLQMQWGVDCMVTSANKCLEGVPGFSLLLCNRALLQEPGPSRSLSLDLREQWAQLEANGQFRHTPPTHSIAAFQKALVEWADEGGSKGRAARYKSNFDVVKKGMEALGFKFYVPDGPHRSILICTFVMPQVKGFNFDTFYRHLQERGFIIYPGKSLECESFRVGTIGRIFPFECAQLVHAASASLKAMKLNLPLQG